MQGGLGVAGLGVLAGCGLVPFASSLATPKVGLFHVGLDHVPPSVDTLFDEMRVLGYEDGKTVHLDWKNLADQNAANAMAQEFVRDGTR